MVSEALKRALRFEDLNIRLAEMHGRTGRDMSPQEVDRFIALSDSIYGRLTSDERDAANRYGKRRWRGMGGKVNAAEERVLPRLKSIERARH